VWCNKATEERAYPHRTIIQCIRESSERFFSQRPPGIAQLTQCRVCLLVIRLMRARWYAYAKIEHVSIRNYVRIFRKIEYVYDTFRTQTRIRPETWRVETRKMLQNGQKNYLVQCNCCDKQFRKLFTFFTKCFKFKLLCCSCNVFYSCLRTLK